MYVFTKDWTIIVGFLLITKFLAIPDNYESPSIPPTDSLNHALCHFRPNDDWQIEKVSGQSSSEGPFCAKMGGYG